MNKQFFDDISSEYVVMKRPRFIQEHEKLLGILERKDPKELDAEKKEQAKELKAYKKVKKAKK